MTQSVHDCAHDCAQPSLRLDGDVQRSGPRAQAGDSVGAEVVQCVLCRACDDTQGELSLTLLLPSRPDLLTLLARVWGAVPRYSSSVSPWLTYFVV